jgi:GcrA cell cycle regulator
MANQHTTDSPWDAERTERLILMWGDGMAAADIGRQLGFSRNAVIGKANRLGLAPHAPRRPEAREHRRKIPAPTPRPSRRPSAQIEPISKETIFMAKIPLSRLMAGR